MSDKKDRNELQEIGKKLDKAIKNANLKKKNIAMVLNVTPQTISNYLTGRRGLNYEDALKIAELTRTNVADFLTTEQKNKHLNIKSKNFVTENDVLVELFDLLGYDVDINTGETLDLEFAIAHRNAEKMYNDQEKIIENHISNAHENGDKLNELKGLKDLSELIERRYKSMLNRAVSLTQNEWNDMKFEIYTAVTSIIEKRTSTIEIDRSDLMNLLIAYNELKTALITDETLIKNPIIKRSLNSFNKFYAEHRLNAEYNVSATNEPKKQSE